MQPAFQRALEHHQQGRFAEAEALYRQILQAQPRHADALHLLGLIALQAGHAEEACHLIGQAIQVRPSDNFHCNLGNALLALGRRREAIGHFRQALALNPRMPEAMLNLGLSLLEEGAIEEAVGCCRQALQLRPGLASVDLHLRMALACRQHGWLDGAIASCVEALRLDDGGRARQAFVQAVRSAHFQSPDDTVRGLLLRALQEGWAEAAELLTPAVSLIEAQPDVREAIAGTGPLSPRQWQALAGDALLLGLLELETLNSIALERLLTRVRRQLLEQALAAARAPDPAIAALQAALARQCFINEYVYACSDEEQQQLDALRGRLQDCHAKGADPDPQCLLAFASYAPLWQLPGAAAWAGRRWPAPLAGLFLQQVTEPAIEARHSAAMPCLTPIDDAVSQQVRAQYEANPYPRWVRAPRVGPPGAAGVLDVLVAGCGTGQHAIQVAQQYEGARVLAIDLSLASLGYARRKTEELGLAQIEYAQADILQLGSLDRRFDLIESVGVLHHLADPLAGLRVLQGLLRPGGRMLLGLYSELGRREVVAARERVMALGPLPESLEDIRRCRQALMADGLAAPFETFLASRDFYSASACRDLLFHVQEHRFTLPQLKAALARLGLAFQGFLLDPDDAAAYSRQFPDDPARTDLEHWHAFETARPQTFARMYVFGVQSTS